MEACHPRQQLYWKIVSLMKLMYFVVSGVFGVFCFLLIPFSDDDSDSVRGDGWVIMVVVVVVVVVVMVVVAVVV